jgi:uncharacterized protein
MALSKSALYDGWVTHRRLTPRRHAFRYRVFALLLDLDEIEGSRLWLFGANRPALFSFRDRDHGDGRPLRAWLDAELAKAGIAAGGARRVLCYPRLFGYVFNPLSVWFCYRTDETLAAIVYEVHNTYGERHAYVLPVRQSLGEGGSVDNDDGLVRQRCAKDFTVSPFLSMDCVYNFKLRPPSDDVLIAISEEEHGRPVLTATFSGRRRPLDDATLFSMLLRHPLMTVKVIAAIHFEALRLMWKGVPRHSRDAATGVRRDAADASTELRAIRPAAGR